jgi:hypothetical protein
MAYDYTSKTMHINGGVEAAATGSTPPPTSQIPVFVSEGVVLQPGGNGFLKMEVDEKFLPNDGKARCFIFEPAGHLHRWAIADSIFVKDFWHLRVPIKDNLPEMSVAQLWKKGDYAGELVQVNPIPPVLYAIVGRDITGHNIHPELETLFTTVQQVVKSAAPDQTLCQVKPETPSPKGLREKHSRQAFLYDMILRTIKDDYPSHIAHGFAHRISRHDDVFSFDNEELGECTSMTHEIHTGGAKPIKAQCRRLSYKVKELVLAKIEEMVRNGTLQHVMSEWASPVVPVMKPNGEVRICVDYRRLNEVTQKDVYPLPNMEDILEEIAEWGAKIYVKFDLRAGFHQIKLSEEAKQKSAMITTGGTFAWQYMPMGLVSAPATFQRVMNHALRHCNAAKVKCYLDDLLIAADGLDDMELQLVSVFEALRKSGLLISIDKTEWCTDKIDFLGFVVSRHGLEVHPSKVSAIREFPRPHSLNGLRRFLGMANYLRKFIPNYSTVAYPLILLTGKVPPVWGKTQQEAFEKLKKIISSTEVLAYPKSDRPFLIETDASTTGIGAVLSQYDDSNAMRPIAYASRALIAAERNYGVSDLEGLAVVYAVRQFKVYIQGRDVHIWTDHTALRALMTSTHLEGRLARWALELQPYLTRIHYKQGATHYAPDALSRQYAETLGKVPFTIDKEEEHVLTVLCPDLGPEERDLLLIAIESDLLTAEEHKWSMIQNAKETDSFQNRCSYLMAVGNWESNLTHDATLCAKLQREDRNLKWIIDSLSERTQGEAAAAKAKAGYSLEGGTLYKHGLVVMPEAAAQTLIADCHQYAHDGASRTMSRLQDKVYIKDLKDKVDSYVAACLPCAKRKLRQKGKQPLMPLPVAKGPNAIWHVDCTNVTKKPLLPVKGKKAPKHAPMTEGVLDTQYTSVLVIKDQFTKYLWVTPLYDQTVGTIMRKLDWLIAMFGAPHKIITDRGAQFVSPIFLCFGKRHQIALSTTTAYHAQSNGQVESANKCLMDILSLVGETRGGQWIHNTPRVIAAYNSAVNATTGMTPFSVMFGRNPRLPSSSAFAQPTREAEADHDYLWNDPVKLEELRNKIAEFVTGNTLQAKVNQKTDYDLRNRVKQIKLHPGSQVMLYDNSVQSSAVRKISHRYTGPFVIESIDQDRGNVQIYDLNDPSKRQLVHPYRLVEYNAKGRRTKEQLLRAELEKNAPGQSFNPATSKTAKARRIDRPIGRRQEREALEAATTSDAQQITGLPPTVSPMQTRAAAKAMLKATSGDRKMDGSKPSPPAEDLVPPGGVTQQRLGARVKNEFKPAYLRPPPSMSPPDGTGELKKGKSGMPDKKRPIIFDPEFKPARKGHQAGVTTNGNSSTSIPGTPMPIAARVTRARMRRLAEMGETTASAGKE